jgi:hypothetical protein
MSLPAMDSQPTLFGSVPSVAGALFSEDDRDLTPFLPVIGKVLTALNALQIEPLLG